MSISSRVEKVTPEVATRLLEGSKDIKNRNVSDGHVAWLAGQMKAGKWTLNGEAIILDDEDQIIDGQHRLWAVVNSGVTIESLITRGVDRKNFSTIDTGSNRTFSNVLGIVGEKYTNALSAALSLLHRHETGRIFTHGKSSGFTSQIGLGLLKKYPEIRESVEFAGKMVSNVVLKRVPTSSIIFLHHRFSLHHKTKAMEFFECVGDLRFDTAGTPTRVLRDMILRRERGLGSTATIELLALFVKAWQHFLDGRKPGRPYQWRRSGEFPEDFPTFPGEQESSGKALKVVRRTKRGKTGT